MSSLKWLGVAAVITAAGCAPTPNPTANPGTGVPAASSAQEQDWAAILRVEAQAKAIVRTDKCANAGECRTAPVGNRCGGPRYYITYCAASTDTAELARLLARARTMEDAYNKRWQIISTCEYRLAPKLRVSGGSCQEVGPSN